MREWCLKAGGFERDCLPNYLDFVTTCQASSAWAKGVVIISGCCLVDLMAICSCIVICPAPSLAGSKSHSALGAVSVL